MLNYKQSSVIEKDAFIDEFETETVNETVNEVQTLQDEEHRAFNARIKDNFDKIINYNAYNRTSQLQEREETVQRFTHGVNYDVSPSSTTMQYKNMPRAEIYKDYREEESVSAEVKLRPRAKLAMFILSAVILVLSVFVVLNTALLNNMNSQIEGRLSAIQELEDRKSVLDDRLSEVSSDEAIIDAAGDIGMIF
ncbi:MAG: hypothetical protein IKL82_04650 [Clostridia bacterium]|nr:hypothetical protein [Clostridia bacterium]